MSEEQPQENSPEAELEGEILAGRKFSLAEAIGRMGGGDLMKGASPVPFKRQAELLIEQYLETHLVDAEGALELVLLRRFSNSDQLLQQGYEKPLSALSAYVQDLLGCEELLRSLVSEVDAQWGRSFGERPYFERPGQPPDPDDPYTIASVRDSLGRLQGEIQSRIASGE